MGMVGGLGMAHGQFSSRNGQVDPDGVELALVVVSMRRIEDHVAGRDVFEEALQLGGMLPDTGFQEGRGGPCCGR